MKIYGLKEKNSTEFRYIGLTRGTLDVRFLRHLRDKKIDHKTNWIKFVGKDNIEIILIENDIDNIELLCEREIYYIDKYKKDGHRLTNVTNGGEGWLNTPFSTKHKRNISLNHANVKGNKNPMFGKTHTIKTMTQIKNKIRCWNKNVGYSQFEIDKRKTRSVGEKNINSILNDRDIIMI